MTLVPPRIDILPEHLIDQIKAGEVIERPGNLLKEILENSVDAGATKIELTLKNNGLDLISLRDNGHGINYEDLPLAFSRHATSKISLFEDLYHLYTFGFRGEALASIASISKLQCISFVENTEEGGEIKIQGGENIFHGKRKQSGFSHGTELIIQELFYNTPVRLKFIQSQNAEKQFIKKMIFAFILSNPNIEFQIKIDDEDKEIFPASKDLLSRIKDILPRAREHIISSKRQYDNNELEIHLVPAQFRPPVKWQYVFINNRFVIDKQFHRVITNSLLSHLGQDDYHYIALLNLPSENIDVNVHPNKTIIKCLESSKIIGLISATIKEFAGNRKNFNNTPIESKTNQISEEFNILTEIPSLTLERQQYNMEGFFSPHRLEQENNSKLNWVGTDFFIKKFDTKHLAFAVKKLLNEYITAKLKTPSSVIPLLVTEPFPSKDVDKHRLEFLIKSGLEIEYLGPETLVLRGIPEWMNGLPLKDIVTCLLFHSDFTTLEINPADWSTSTWEEMISSFPINELIKNKIALNLEDILREKLK